MALSRWLYLLILLFSSGTSYAISLTDLETPTPVSDPAVQSPDTFLESPYFHLRHHEGEHIHAKATPVPITDYDLKMTSRYRNWSIGAGIGMDFPFAGWNSAYNFGTGSNFEIAYAFTKGWVMGVGLTLMNYSGSYYQTPLADSNVNLHWLTRLGFRSGGIDPYLTMQIGEVWQQATAYGSSVKQQNPALGIGAGVELGLDSTFDFYGEGLVDFIFTPGSTAVDLPFTTGIRLKL